MSAQAVTDRPPAALSHPSLAPLGEVITSGVISWTREVDGEVMGFFVGSVVWPLVSFVDGW